MQSNDQIISKFSNEGIIKIESALSIKILSSSEREGLFALPDDQKDLIQQYSTTIDHPEFSAKAKGVIQKSNNVQVPIISLSDNQAILISDNCIEIL